MAPLRSGSRCGSGSIAGAKTAKKAKKDEGGGFGKGRGSDNAATCSEQLLQDFCTPSLPCWAAAERDALEQLTDAFFSRHRLHLRVWPVSAGGGTAADAGASSTGPVSRGSSTSTVGGQAARRKGRAATAPATGKDEPSKKDGRASNVLEKKSSEADPLRRAGSVGAAGGSAAAAERTGSRRGSTHNRAEAAESGTLQQMEHVKRVKGEETATEEEDEATRVRREQLLNVRAMLYDRVTENVSFTCTEYNTPFKPSRNAKLPTFLRLRGSGACVGSEHPFFKDAAAERAVASKREAEGGAAAAAADNAAVLQAGRLRQVQQRRDNTTTDGEPQREGNSCCESGASLAVAELKKEPGGAEQQQRDGPCSVRWQHSQQQSASTATATAGRKSAKPVEHDGAITGSSTGCGDAEGVSSKQEWTQGEQESPRSTDACGDPGKLKELQQSLLSDGFTGCWVLLLTEKYIPADSPTALSPQHSNQTSGASSFAPGQQTQRRSSAGEEGTASSSSSAPTAGAGEQGKSAEEAAHHAAEEGAGASEEYAAEAVTGEYNDGAGAQVLQQEPQQQQHPRVRRIIVCGALIEVYSNNERQIAALWCLPCLSAHATRLLLQAFLPRVLLEALRIPDVAATPVEEQAEENAGWTQAREGSSSSKKRKWKQEGGTREAGKGGERKQQQRQQRSSGGGGSLQKKLSGEEGQTSKQQNGYSLDEGEKGRRRKSSCLTEETEFTNIPAVSGRDAKSRMHAAGAKDEVGQPQQLLRPIKSVFAVYEDILLWPRQALFLLAASSRLGFLRHAEPLLGVPADEEEEESASVAGRKTAGTEEKQRRSMAYRKQPYLHVDAGLGPEWRDCNCRTRFFSSRLQTAQQRKRRATNISSGKGSGTAPAPTGKAGAGEEASSSASSRKGGGTAPGATAGTWGGGSDVSISRRESCSSKDASSNGDGLLRFFSVSDLWAARLMPPREKRAALQQAESTAVQLQSAAGRTIEGGNASSSPTAAGSWPSTREKLGRATHHTTETELVEENWSCRNEATKQEEMRETMGVTGTTNTASRSSVGDEGRQEAVWSSEQQREKKKKGEGVDTTSSKFWPEATDGWSCLVPRGTSGQILREIYCDLAVLSETHFEECLSEEVDISQDEMCGLQESECRELLRWWDK